MIADLIRSTRFRWNSEKDLQDGLAAILPDAIREHQLSRGDIVDFFQDGCAIEVKVAGTPATVLRQLTRYASHPEVTSLILVTGRTQLRRMPAKVLGKHLEVVSLIGSLL